jgi:hypothetical protein
MGTCSSDDLPKLTESGAVFVVQEIKGNNCEENW